ncbi:MAG: 6-pyruvoyl tetrahydropterin synthase family protein [Promethearchaeota archaeon]
MKFSVKQSHERYYISVAHLVIGEDYSEALHGHNIGVDVEVKAPINKTKMVIDFLDLNPIIEETLQEWDHFTLIPGKNPQLLIKEHETTIEMIFPDKKYRLPKEDVKILPISNATVEEMAECLVNKLTERLQEYNLEEICVTVYEYPWQSATCCKQFT